jgi:hypothetical protein
MAARLGNVLYWLGCIVAVGWVAVSHAEEKADDDSFILGCIWTGDHKRTVCGEFTTRAFLWCAFCGGLRLLLVAPDFPQLHNAR